MLLREVQSQREHNFGENISRIVGKYYGPVIEFLKSILVLSFQISIFPISGN